MSGGGGLNQDYNRDRSRSPMDRKPAMNKSRSRRPTRRIQVSNIPYEYKWQDLKDLFRQEVGEVTYVDLYKDDNGRPRGTGVVEFATEDNAAKAIEKMHRYEIGDRNIIVKEDHGDGNRSSNRGRDNDRMPATNTAFGGISRMSDLQNMASMANLAAGMGGGGSVGVDYGNTYGLSTQFIESLGINSPLVNRVFVANLDYSVDEEKLHEVFKIAGKVINVELSKDPETKKSRGFGVVEFDHPVEAVQAISMLNGQWFFERKLSVRMDRINDNKKKDTGGSSKLPAGLKGIGMGLGFNGSALTDVSCLSTTTNNVPSTNNSLGGMPDASRMSAAAGMGNMGLMNQSAGLMGAGGGASGFNAMGMNPGMADNFGGNDGLATAMSGMLGGMGAGNLMSAMAQQMQQRGGAGGVNQRAFGGGGGGGGRFRN